MLIKSLAPALGFICAAIVIAPVAEAGCGHRHGGGGGYSSYQSRPSGAYAAQLRAERKAAARAAAARRAKIAAAKAEKARVAKAAAAEKTAVKTAAAPEPVKADAAVTTTGSIDKPKDKIDVAEAQTTCSKFIPAIGTSVPVACDQK